MHNLYDNLYLHLYHQVEEPLVMVQHLSTLKILVKHYN